MDLEFSKDMFDITDKITHKFEIINAVSSLLLKAITFNSTSFKNFIFQNKIYYFVVSKIAILNDDHQTYHSSLLNIKKKEFVTHITQNISTYYLIKGTLLSRHNFIIMKIVIREFN